MRMTATLKAALIAGLLTVAACGDDRPPVNGNGNTPTYPSEPHQGDDGLHPQMPVTK